MLMPVLFEYSCRRFRQTTPFSGVPFGSFLLDLRKPFGVVGARLKGRVARDGMSHPAVCGKSGELCDPNSTRHRAHIFYKVATSKIVLAEDEDC